MYDDDDDDDDDDDNDDDATDVVVYILSHISCMLILVLFIVTIKNIEYHVYTRCLLLQLLLLLLLLLLQLLIGNFIFWQKLDVSEDSKVYSNYYKINSCPHIAILDPRTGMVVIRVGF